MGRSLSSDFTTREGALHLLQLHVAGQDFLRSHLQVVGLEHEEAVFSALLTIEIAPEPEAEEAALSGVAEVLGDLALDQDAGGPFHKRLFRELLLGRPSA